MLATISVSKKFSSTARTVIVTLANGILCSLIAYSLKFDIWNAIAIGISNSLVWGISSIFASKLFANRFGSVIAAIANIIACYTIALLMGFNHETIYSTFGYIVFLSLQLSISFILAILLSSPKLFPKLLTKVIPNPIKGLIFTLTCTILVLVLTFDEIFGLRQLLFFNGWFAGIIGLISWNTFNQPIIPAETLKWSWENAKYKATTGQIIGLVIGLIVGAITTMFDLGLFLSFFSVMDKIK